MRQPPQILKIVICILGVVSAALWLTRLLSESPHPNPNHLITVHRVFNDPQKGKLFSTPEMPNVGYIRHKPELVVAVKSVSIESIMGRSDPLVFITFFERDARAFRKFSKRYEGEKVLFSYKGTPFLAPIAHEFPGDTIMLSFPTNLTTNVSRIFNEFPQQPRSSPSQVNR